MRLACTFRASTKLGPATPLSCCAAGAGLLDQCGRRQRASGRKTLASRQAAILFFTGRALADRQAKPDLKDPAPSDPADGSKLAQARTVDNSSSSYPSPRPNRRNGRRREAHGHHRVGARTRGTAPASQVCGGAARDRRDAPLRNRPEHEKRRPTRAPWPAARRRRRHEHA